MEMTEMDAIKSEIELKINMVQQAVQYAKDNGFSRVDLETDVVEALLEGYESMLVSKSDSRV